jgi:hypothetical protein
MSEQLLQVLPEGFNLTAVGLGFQPGLVERFSGFYGIQLHTNGKGSKNGRANLEIYSKNPVANFSKFNPVEYFYQKSVVKS